MKVIMIVYQDEAASKVATEQQMAASLDRFNVFHDKVASSGHLKDSFRLLHSDRAKLVSVRDQKTIAVDGPYAETKEQLGGFYLMECADIDEAIELAARIPTAGSGYIEIRPLFGEA